MSHQPVLLALDSATEACSAALQVGNSVLERHQVCGRGHAARLLPMVQELLDEAGLAPGALQAVTLCRGPGSFTGVRIAIGVAQGIALGAGLPLVPVSTLACLAQGAWRRHGAGQVLAALDARMGEVYWGAFGLKDGVMQAMEPERVARPDAASAPQGGPWFGAGSGWQAYGQALAAACGARLYATDPDALPTARDCLEPARRALRHGAAVDALALQPVYLRDRVTG